MYKKICLFLLLLLAPLCTLALDVELSSKNALVYDVEKGEFLFEYGKEEQVKIASLTKIMTSIVALENIENLSEEVTITYDMLKGVPWDASVAKLKVGDRVTYRDLVYASLLPSGADATDSLAYIISGSTEGFVKLMNKKTEELGLINTHFVNTTGYDREGHYSTPKEVLKLLLYCLKNETFKEIYTTKTYTLTNGLVVNSTLTLYNKIYNYDLSNIIGSKTGYTNGAGTCMSALINSQGKELVLITLGAKVEPKKAHNLEDTMAIIRALDNEYENKVIFKSGETILKLPVYFSKDKVYEISPKKDVKYYIRRDSKTNESYEYTGKKFLSFWDKKGEELGKIKYYYGKELIGEETLILNQDLKISYAKIILPTLVFLIIIVFTSKILKKKKRRAHK